METEAGNEVWEVEANGQIFQSNFDEMTTWIREGSLLRIDRVRKANLRWIEAGKVPSLVEFFNAKDASEVNGPNITTTNAVASRGTHRDRIDGGAVGAPVRASDVCTMHADAPAAYICETCSNVFCKACPNSYGGTVKICPFCGAMCKSITEVINQRNQAAVTQKAASEGFGFSDFINALAYPFKFKFSLIVGAIMFAFFSIGQGAAGFGGIFMLSASIFCFMLANMLTFGVLANTVNNFSQGKIGLDFMPSFDDFSLWDDVIQPFFLSIGVYIVSFGPLIAVFVISFFFLIGAVGGEMNAAQADAARMTNPELPYAANAAKQSEAVRELLQKQGEKQANRVAAINEQTLAAAEGDEEFEGMPANTANTAVSEEEEFAQLEQMIQDSRKAQLESAIGKTPETVAAERSEMITQILGYGAMFLLAAGICLLWGIFYFPAACAVAGYTQSFAATVNPAVGIDTIRRLGGSYFMILLMGFLIFIAYCFVGGVVSAILSPFDMPAVGNLPAAAIASLFGFYFSVVFSCVLGFAMYKNADRLKLFQ